MVVNSTFFPVTQKRESASQLSLLDTPAERVSHRQRSIERMVPLMLELADRAGPFDPRTRSGGVTVCNLRHAAIKAMILTGGESGRELSYLTVVPRKAGLVSTGHRRYSDIPGSRNDHVIYVHPRYAEEAA